MDRFSFSPLFSPGAVAQVLLKATVLSFLVSTPIKKLDRGARVFFGRARALKENVNCCWTSILWLSFLISSPASVAVQHQRSGIKTNFVLSLLSLNSSSLQLGEDIALIHMDKAGVHITNELS